MTRHLIEDDLNRRLLALLQQDGRMAHAELAERLGVSRPTVIERVRRLEEDGVIAGYAARVPAEKVGKPCVAFVAVRYKPGTDDAAEERFLRALEKEPDVLEAHTVAGEDCLLLKVVAADPQGVNERLRRIRALGNQVTTRTTVVLATHFEKPGPSPFPAEGRGAPARGGKP